MGRHHRARNGIIGLIVLFSGVLGGARALAEGEFPPNYTAGNVTAYAELVRSYGEYIRMVAEARLAIARARLTEAQALHELQRARHLKLMVDRLALELRNLAREEYYLRKQAASIGQRARTLGPLTWGKTSPHVFRALNLLFVKILPLGNLIEVMTAEIGPLDASDFIPNRKDREAIPFEGGNVGSLIRFLQKNDFSLEPWSPAHVHVLETLKSVNELAAKELQNIRQHMVDIRKGVFDVWRAPGAPPTEGPEAL